VLEQIVLFVLMSLASYRLWRLIGYDTISASIRDELPGDDGSGFSFREMVECPWCLGSWIAFTVVGITALVTDVRWPVLQALACAVVVGWLHELIEGHGEVEVEINLEDEA
jgi:hypothetical protein